MPCLSLELIRGQLDHYAEDDAEAAIAAILCAGRKPITCTSQSTSDLFDMKQDLIHSLSRPLSACFAIFLGLGFLLMGVGCRSLSEPASASFASVTIEDHSEAEIAAALMQVFEADGFSGLRTGQSQLTFDREASRATTLSREGLVNTQAGARTINRVVVDIVRLSAAYRVQCQAYMVTGGSDSFFQDEVPLAHFRSGPYQSLLNKVKKQLK